MKKKSDDRFQDDDWGPTDGAIPDSFDEMPEAIVDPNRTDWLKPWHLDARQGTFELLSVSGATEFSDVTLHIQIGRKNFRLGLRTFDAGYMALKNKYGKKPSDWHGTLRFKVMPHKGRPDGYVSVRPA